MRFYDINMLHFFWLLPLVAAFFVYAVYRRRILLQRLIESELLERIPRNFDPRRRIWKYVLVLGGLFFVVFALARPAWNPKPEEVTREGRDVVFVLDVSRSMLAEDLRPNRLERAKLAIKDCVERLEGDRVGLVAFAGDSVVRCPLTVDYGFFGMMLDSLSPDDIGRGGTMLGDAFRKTLDDVFDKQQTAYKDIILITDGEDHGSFPVEVAKRAGERGIRIIAIGLGDSNEGQRIPITKNGKKTYLKHNGKEVWTKLDAETLRKMAAASKNGKYFNVTTGTINLGEVYQDLIASAEKRRLETETVKRYQDKFQIFLAIAFVLLFAEMLISERSRKFAPPETTATNDQR